VKVERIGIGTGSGPPDPAWEVIPEATPWAGAVLLHGYGSSKEAMLGLAVALAEAGLTCTIPDLPGHGENPRAFGPGVVESARAAVRHARRHGAAVAVGHSLGGRLALLSQADAVVAMSPALPQEPSAAGVYALRTFATPKVRQERPGQVVEVLAGLPSHTTDGTPVLILLAEGDIPSIVSASEHLASSLPAAEIRRVSEGMVLEAEDPPAGFGSYIRHWMNHEGLPGTRVVALDVAAWAGTVLNPGDGPGAPVQEGR
jgi:dienelactone hydrolase